MQHQSTVLSKYFAKQACRLELNFFQHRHCKMFVKDNEWDNRTLFPFVYGMHQKPYWKVFLLFRTKRMESFKISFTDWTLEMLLCLTQCFNHWKFACNTAKTQYYSLSNDIIVITYSWQAAFLCINDVALMSCLCRALFIPQRKRNALWELVNKTHQKFTIFGFVEWETCPLWPTFDVCRIRGVRLT